MASTSSEKITLSAEFIQYYHGQLGHTLVVIVSDTRRAALLLVGAAASAALAVSAVAAWRRSRKYGGLDGAVSVTSRTIASLRALEAEQSDPLFSDPFAEVRRYVPIEGVA